MQTPVLLLNFNRPRYTAGLIECLRPLEPQYIYVSIDGPRADHPEDVRLCAEVEQTLSAITWNANVKLLKRSANAGLRRNVKDSIDWMFSEHEQGIILEDDVRFGADLLQYFSTGLHAYAGDERIGALSGNNMVAHLPGYPRQGSDNFLCQIFHCWGWATWKDRWALYDDAIENDLEFLDNALAEEIPNAGAVAFWRRIAEGFRNGTVNSWAWRMQLSMLRAKRRFVTPAVNLATNIGFEEDSTHTAQKPAWLQGWGTGSFTMPPADAPEPKADENLDQFENQVILGVPITKSLDLGCGRVPKNLFNADMLYGIDVRDDLERRIKKADLVVEPIPFEDSYFDFVTAHDFIEHIPRLIYCPQRRYPFVELMNEIYRVLKPNGRFLSFTPAFPHPEVFRDPTHVNIITDQTYTAYFDEVNRWGQMYGFNGAFRIMSQEWRGPHLLSILQKVLTPAGLIAT